MKSKYVVIMKSSSDEEFQVLDTTHEHPKTFVKRLVIGLVVIYKLFQTLKDHLS